MAEKKKRPMEIGETRIKVHKIDGKPRKVRVTKLEKGKYRIRMLKTRKRKYHGFFSKKVYLAFKAHWKKHRKRKKGKVRIGLKTARQLKEAAKIIKTIKAGESRKPVLEQLRYVESLDDKIARVKQMLKHLEYEFLKRHISFEEYNRRKFEYMEALRYLEVQKKRQEEAAGKAKPKPTKEEAAAAAGRAKGMEMPEPITVRPPRIKIERKHAKPEAREEIRPTKPEAREEGKPSKPEAVKEGKPTKPEAREEGKPTKAGAAAVAGGARGMEMPEPITVRPPRTKIGRKHAKPEAREEIRPTKPEAVKEGKPTKPEAREEGKPTKPSATAETQKKIVETLKKLGEKVREATGKGESLKKAEEAPERVGEKEAKKTWAGMPGETKPKAAAEEMEVKPFKIKPRKPLPKEGPKKSTIQTISVETPIDKLVELLKNNKKMSFKSLARILNWSIESVERVGIVLEKQGIVDVHYPTMVTAEPSISFIKALPAVSKLEVVGKQIEEYGFVVDFVPANVKIYLVKQEQRPIYHLVTPYVGAYTKAFFDELKEDIAEQIPIEVSEINDVKKSAELKKRFFSVAKKELQKYLGESPPQQIDVLAGLLLHSMYGLGEIEILAGDNRLEEIAINSSKTPVTVYHKKYGWLQTSVFMKSEEEIFNYSAQIARKVGREINTLNPILDAHLLSGDRVNATLNPISSFGDTITIRRFARRPWTIIDFIGKSHSMNLEMASILWMAMQYEMSIIVAGGTASGKTSCLNVLTSMIPAYHRIISIEDVREIMLPKYMHWNWVPLTTRNPNPEGKGEVSMLELMQSTLRMRPDRIILGEIRRKREAEVLFEAMHTGHSVYSTLHANNAQQVLRRLTEPPIALPPLEIEAVDLLMVQYRDRRKNIRRTYEISEIESGVSGEQVVINTVFRWDPRSDQWDSVNPATKFIRQINLHTGMTEDEITQDLEARATILQWMLENKWGEIDQVGQVMKMFYNHPKRLRESAEKNESPQKVLGGKI